MTQLLKATVRSTHSQKLFKTGLKNFTNFTGKHLCWTLFLIKLQPFRPTTLLKRDSNTGVSCEICKDFKNTYFYGTSPIMLLYRVFKIFASQCLNPFHARVLFPYLLKTSEHLWFSDLFRGVQKWSIGVKWVNVLVDSIYSTANDDTFMH